MTITPANLSQPDARQSLLARFADFKRQIHKHVTLTGVSILVIELVALILLSLILDKLFRLHLPTRLALAACGLAFLGYELYKRILEPLFKPTTELSLALALDDAKQTHTIAPKVATILESNHAHDSPLMAQLAIRQAHESLAKVDFADHLDRAKLTHHLRLGGAALALLLLVTILFPSTMKLWSKRWLLASNQPWPQKTYLQLANLTNGKLLIPRGEPATLIIQAQPNSVVPDSVKLRLKPQNGKRTESVMTKFADNDFRHDLPPVQARLTLEAEGNDDQYGPIEIEPVDRPRITQLKLIAQHPLDKEPSIHLFTGESSDLSFLPQTRLRLEVTASVPLAQLKLGDAEKNLTPEQLQKTDDSYYAIVWTHTKAMSFQLELLSKELNLASIPTPLTIGLKSDAPPRTTLAYTGVRARITPQATIPFTTSARDDYGLARMILTTKLEFLDPDQKRQTSTTEVNLFGPQSPATELEVQQPAPYAVSQLKPPIGAVLSFQAVSTDARYESPQEGKSREATFRIVSPEELFRDILVRQQGERQKFRKSLEEAGKIRTDLAAMNSKESAGALARRHRALQRELNRQTVALTDSLMEMRLNVLGSPESYELMQRNVLTPLAKLNEELLNPQRDALDSMAGGSTIDTGSTTARQDEIVARMTDILKQMNQWDSFVDVLNQLNEIIRLQEQARQKTEELKTKQSESIFDK